MCKLCNTNRPAIKTVRKNSSKLRKEINAIVYDYLSEYMCNFCSTSLYTSCKHNNTSIDKAILQKLYNAYKPFSGRKLSKIKCETKRATKCILGCTIRIYTKNDGNITVTYMAILRFTKDKKRIYGKTRNTLEEAIKDRIELIKKYKTEKQVHEYLKSIEKYNQKLKESQNE